jgi:Na+/H+ antiporter NhaC
VTSIVAGDFYKVPITVAFLVSAVYGVAIMREVPMEQRISLFSKGAGSPNMMLMFWIFVLAGAFAHTAKDMGAIDATVNLTLAVTSGHLLLAGVFLASCFISLSIGTSVGTVVALTPIAAGIASHTGSSMPLLVAIVVGGAYFGDNLSFISDTTIIATRTQGCKLSDKFRVNFLIVLPAAVMALALYLLLGQTVNEPAKTAPIEWLKVIPYLVVLVTAIAGVNVMIVLTIGIVLAGIIGMGCGAFDVYGWFGSMGTGIESMGELIIITMLAGGLLEVVRHNGGLDFIIELMTKHIKGKRGAELSIAGLVTVTDLCTANNTVAIITVGPIANEISERFGVDKRKSASILDTFSCFAQGIIPYGAQILMAAGLANINPVSIVPYLYYPYMMGACALLAILFRFPRKYS